LLIFAAHIFAAEVPPRDDYASMRPPLPPPPPLYAAAATPLLALPLLMLHCHF